VSPTEAPTSTSVTGRSSVRWTMRTTRTSGELYVGHRRMNAGYGCPMLTRTECPCSRMCVVPHARRSSRLHARSHTVAPTRERASGAVYTRPR
jgi:hypothetical protein